MPERNQPTEVEPGAVAVISGDAPYLVADDPATSPTVEILPSQECRALDGRPLRDEMALGIRTLGSSPTGGRVTLNGT